MKKKILALCLCVALAATAIVGASLAYFTDTDEATNTFAVGNVSIDLIEQQRVADEEGKWNADQLVDYVIRYTDEAGTEIAPPTTGKALAGTTKTFDAKAGDELNEGYRTGYYPKTNSHSMVMEIKGENEKNEYTFVYKQMPMVQYTVRYINRATGNNVFEGAGTVDEKTGMTSAAVWTETFLPITGYRPDAYQKRLVLSVNAADNVITFYYDKDEVRLHAVLLACRQRHHHHQLHLPHPDGSAQLAGRGAGRAWCAADCAGAHNLRKTQKSLARIKDAQGHAIRTKKHTAAGTPRRL